ncbi:MAG: ABC transporter permease [Bacteroidetes bacterium]|nr:ABC transporter permease [Bacteroidota bacterium]
MNLSFFIARRYLISKKSNNAINIISWISIVVIGLSTAALVIVLSAMNGLTATVAELYHAPEADIKISPAQSKYFSDYGPIEAKIKSVEGVRLIAHSLQENALIKLDDRQAVIVVKGVDENFKNINHFDTVVTEGSYRLKYKGLNYAVYGRGVAGRLGININDFLSPATIYAPKRGRQEGMETDPFTSVSLLPGGVFSLNDDFDFKYVLVDLGVAQNLFECPGEITSFEIACNSRDDIDRVQARLKTMLGAGYEVRNRYQINDVLFKTLETEKLWTFIILAFILVIATFNIIGALTMLIIEKKNDIKTFYHLGADTTFMRRIFMNEGFLITLVGAGSGLLLGLLVCFLQIKFHLVKFDDQYVIPYYPIELQLKDFLWILGVVMGIGFLAALYPVRVFTKHDLVHD